MKKIFMIALLCAMAGNLKAQSVFPTDGSNVGIGTTTPLSLLHVNGNIAAAAAANPTNTYFQFQRSSDGYTGARVGNAYSMNGYRGHLVFETNNGGGATDLIERMRVTSDGNVGIGTTTPGDQLVVNGAIRTIVNSATGYGSYGGGLVAFDQSNGGNNMFSLVRQSNNLAISAWDGIGFTAGVSSTSTSYQMYINSVGQVGIGTTNPLQKLVSTGTILNVAITGSNNGISHTSFTDGIYSALHSAAPTEGVGIWSDNQGNASVGALYDNAASSLNLVVRGASSANGLVAMKIMGSGNVGIGTTDPGSYKLAVNGTIHSKSVIIDLVGWPDYVFKPNYMLRPLSEIKTFIGENHHLPDMPSAAAVEKDGLNLGEMNKLLVKKVEELTLYLIEQQKEIDQLKKRQNDN